MEPYRLEEEEIIRFFFLLRLNLDLRSLNAEPFYDDDDRLSKKDFHSLLYNFSYLLTEIPSSVNRINEVDAFINRTKKSFLIEFKAPCVYQRGKNTPMILTSEIKWRQIIFMKEVTKIGWEMLNAEIGYYTIPFPSVDFKKYKSLEKLLEMPKQDLDVMGIRVKEPSKKDKFINSIRLCDSSKMDLSQGCNHTGRKCHIKKTRISREGTIWEVSTLSPEEYQFHFEINKFLKENKITPVTTSGVQGRSDPCSYLEITTGSTLKYEEFFKAINDLPNPGSKFTPIILLIVNSLIQTRGKLKELEKKYYEIKNYVKGINDDDKLEFLEFNDLIPHFKIMCPDVSFLPELKNWLNSLILIGIR